MICRSFIFSAAPHHFFNRRAVLKTLVLALFFSWSSAAFADYVVQGRKLSWTMTAVAGWIGGNYEQIEKIAHGSSNATARKLSQAMLRQAVNLDAYLINLDAKGIATRTLTSLRINVAGGFSASDLNRTWSGYADLILRDHPAGSTSRVVSRKSLTVGGYEAHEGLIEVVRPGNRKLYQAMCIVMISGAKSHLFRLQADETKFKKAHVDFRRMLDSVKYY